MTAIVLRGDAMRLPIPDNTVDLVITSPPYFALRDYRDGGASLPGQVGSEPNPAAFVDALICATREMVRVLKPSGSIFVNLGDKYSQRVALRRSSSHQDGLFPGRPELAKDWKRDRAAGLARMPYENVTDAATGSYVPEKSLMGLPWRYALRCIDDLGLILRAELIWSKPNGLPESVTDRVRRSHETWFHFTREPRYYSAVDEIREGYRLPNSAWGHGNGATVSYAVSRSTGYEHNEAKTPNALGKLPGSVWTVPTAPLTVPDHLAVDHFAAFPPEWPKRLILGWSPPGVCTACGEGRRPSVARGSQPPEPVRGGNRLPAGVAGNGTLGFRASKLSGQEWNAHRAANPDVITGYVCACTPYTDRPGSGESSGEGFSRPGEGVNAGSYVREFQSSPVGGSSSLANRPKVGPTREYHHDRWTPAPTTPAVICDPFGGTGTVAMVAHALGRTGISVDLSADYTRLAQWRTADLAQQAKVRDELFRKPEPVADGQASLFEGVL